MGIQGLQALLEPYSTTVTFQQLSLSPQASIREHSTASVSPQHFAIIDGPSLAYHALSIAQSHVRAQFHQWRTRGKQTNPTNASNFTRRNGALSTSNASMPSYQAVAAAMVAWLIALRDHGIHIHAIIFDGALPKWKRSIRVERMRRLAVKLGECRDNIEQDDNNDEGAATHIDSLERIRLLRFQQKTTDEYIGNDADASHQSHRSETETQDHIYFSAAKLAFHNHPNRVSPSSLSNVDFPAPIFLVAAMLECLRNHELFADAVRMVPGEADPYCAGYAQQLCLSKPDALVVVVTSDSDLLAYDLGPAGRVMLFRDIDIVEAEGDDASCSSSKKTVLQARVYAAHDIAQRHGLKTLLPLAYSVHNDRFRSFNTHLVEAKKQESNASQTSAMYRLFCQEYVSRIFENNSEDQAGAVSAELAQTLQELDTKNSEIVQQFVNRQSFGLRDDALEVFLPAGHEDAHRASMWIRGKDVRTLAYSILSSSKPGRVSTAVEHYRKGSRIGETSVSLLRGAALQQVIEQTCKALQEAIALVSVSTASPSWRELGLLWLCEALVQDEKPVPRRRVLCDVYRCSVLRCWDTMHLYAQYQAILDSWRMLAQCVRVHVALLDDQNAVSITIKSLLECIDLVGGSGIQHVFDPILETECNNDRMQAVINRIFSDLEVEEEDPEVTSSSKKRKKKQKDKSGQASSKALKVTGNMFDLLSTMDDA